MKASIAGWRLLLLSFCIVFCVVIYAGCAQKADSDTQQKDEITLRVLTVGSSSEEACERISRALSEITMQRLGFSVELIQTSMIDYDEELSRLHMLNNSPDLFCYMQPEDLLKYVEGGYVYPLDQMLENFPWLTGYVTAETWTCVRIGSKTYAVPANNSINYCQGFVARTDILEELGIDPATITDWDSLHSLLLQVKTTYPDMTPVVSHFGQTLQTLGQDPLGDNLGVLLDNRGTTVENLYASSQYAEVCARMYQWYQEGLIQKDAAMGGDAAARMLYLHNGFGYFVKMNEDNLVSNINSAGISLSPIVLGDTIANSSSVNLGWCIASSCEYKQQAMELLELIYTDQETADLCIYGQEGIDYLRLDQDTVTSIDIQPEAAWNTVAWGWPNRDVASVWQLSDGELPVFPTTGARRSPAMGFVFDSTPVQAAVNRCKTITQKYHNALMSGYLDPDEALPRFLQELEEAGIQDVIDEKQSQLDIWLSSR